MRDLAKEPLPLTAFTHAEPGRLTVSARHVERWAQEMTAAGLIFECEGLLYITKAGLDETSRPTSVAHCRTHCSASQPVWVPPKWTPVRSGADQHLQYKSRGF